MNVSCRIDLGLSQILLEIYAELGPLHTMSEGREVVDQSDCKKTKNSVSRPFTPEAKVHMSSLSKMPMWQDFLTKMTDS